MSAGPDESKYNKIGLIWEDFLALSPSNNLLLRLWSRVEH